MTVTFTIREQCALCGYWLKGVLYTTVRVNRHSIRTTTPGIGALDWRCPECGTKRQGVTRQHRSLDWESQQKIRAHRERKGWVRDKVEGGTSGDGAESVRPATR